MKKEKLFLSTIDPRGAELAAAWGLGVEIAEFCTAANMDGAFGRYDKKVQKALEGIPRRILHGPFNELHPCAVDPKARALAAFRFAQSCGLAERYGAEKIVFHGGFLPYVYYPCWYVEQSVRFWREFLGQIPETLTVCLENVLESDPGWMKEIITEVSDPRLAVCLDVGHANVYSKCSVMDWAQALGTCIRHVHLHNNAGEADTHSPLSQGTVPIKELLHRLEEAAPYASVTLETADGEKDLYWLREQGILEEEL